MVGKNRQLEHAMHQEHKDKFPLVFLAHNIDVTRNIGGLFRIADALGVEKIYLTGSSFTPDNPKVKKSSRSTIKYVPFDYVRDPLSVIARLQDDGFTIISLEITSESVPLHQLNLQNGQKICLVLGAENEGVSQALLDVSDMTVHIPMFGVNSSMNVATACAIASYEITKQLESSSHS